MVFSKDEVKELASQHDYMELEVAPNNRNHMLQFRHVGKKGCGGTAKEVGPVQICVYFTTGRVSTSLEHPRAGKGQLQRVVADTSMLARVFNNPRVHSNTGYHKKEETRKKHKENGLNPKIITSLACVKYKCSLVPGPPQDRGKVGVFKHPSGFRIMVWFQTGTLGVQQKNEKDVYVKNLNMRSIEKYLETPLLAESENKNSGNPVRSSLSTYRPPLADIQQSSSSQSRTQTIVSELDRTEDTRPVSSVGKADLVCLADQKGFSMIKDNGAMLQFKSGKAGPVVNVYQSKGTVLVQGKKGLNQTIKDSSVNDFLMLLRKHNSSTSSENMMSRDTNTQHVTSQDVPGTETDRARTLRLARENASRMFQ